jgi:hypothetical protein
MVFERLMNTVNDRHEACGEIPGLERTAAVIDEVFGLVWYRMLFAYEPLDNKQLCTNQEGERWPSP